MGACHQGNNSNSLESKLHNEQNQAKKEEKTEEKNVESPIFDINTDNPWESLKKHLSKDAEFITDTETQKYNQAREQFGFWENSKEMINTTMAPTVIIYAATEDDVTAVVYFAKQLNYVVGLRSGGHQISGMSSVNKNAGPSIQLDMSRFDYINIPDKFNENRKDHKVYGEIHIGAGRMLKDIYAALVPYNIFICGGVCKTVAIGGHYQSSSVGLLMRSFGLGLDNCKSFRISLSKFNGKIVTVTADNEYHDLYWAVLGGNPGSWGVVIDYTVAVFNDFDYPNSCSFRYFWPYDPKTFKVIFEHYLQVLSSKAYSELRDYLQYLVVAPEIINPYMAIKDGIVKKKHWIVMSGCWTGIDSGNINSKIPRQYLDEFAAEGITFYDAFVGSLLKQAPDYIRFISSEFKGLGCSKIVHYDSYNVPIGPLQYYWKHQCESMVPASLLPVENAIAEFCKTCDIPKDIEKLLEDAVKVMGGVTIDKIMNWVADFYAREGGVDIKTETSRYAVMSRISLTKMDNLGYVDAMIECLNNLIYSKKEHKNLWVVYQLPSFGGQVQLNTGFNSFPWRNMQIGIDIKVTWRGSLNGNENEQAMKWIEEATKITQKYWNFGKYPDGVQLLYCTNRADLNMNEKWWLYYPNRTFYNRLRRIKGKYDHVNIFRNSLTIPPPGDDEKSDEKSDEL